MSDESAPQQEPRLNLKSEPDKDPVQSPPAPSASPSPSPDEPAGAASEKVRLKVRVPIQPPEAALPGESTPLAAAPVAVEPSASEEKAEAGAKLKLKPKAVAPPSSTPPAPIPPAGGENPPDRGRRDWPRRWSRPWSAPPLPRPPPPPPPRVGDRAPVGKGAVGGAAAPSSPAPPPVPEPPLLTAVEAKPPSLRLGLVTLVLCVVVLVVFSGVGYRTYKKLTAGAAKQPPPAAAPVAPVTPQGRAVQKARDAVAAVAANRTAPTNEVIGSERGAGSATSTSPGGVPAPAAATQATPNAAAPAAVVAPSQRFRVFIDRLKIGGVRVGPPPRLFLGGVTYRPGEVIDPSLGIVFVSVDVTAQEIVFKDGTGAVVRRRY
jgi:hypothetical protein